MRFWLKEDSGCLEVKGVKVKKGQGSHFVDFVGHAWDPTADIPEIRPECILRVTDREVIADNFRREGVYHYQGAVLVAKNGYEIEPGGRRSGSSTVWRTQFVSVDAPTLGLAKEIFSLFRQGKLQPEEDWSGGERFIIVGDCLKTADGESVFPDADHDNPAEDPPEFMGEEEGEEDQGVLGTFSD
jgi:hypothetical protein